MMFAKHKGWFVSIYMPQLYEVLQAQNLAPTHWMEPPPDPV